MKRCPVCHRSVFRTYRGYIARHTDTLGMESCPMSGEPFVLAEDGPGALLWYPTRRGWSRAA